MNRVRTSSTIGRARSCAPPQRSSRPRHSAWARCVLGDHQPWRATAARGGANRDPEFVRNGNARARTTPRPGVGGVRPKWAKCPGCHWRSRLQRCEGGGAEVGIRNMHPVTVAIGDGEPDLAVVNYNSNNISVLLSNGDGTFKSKVDYGAVIYPQYLVLRDLNRSAVYFELLNGS